jgi:tRNA(Ile)-lysidine synthase
MILQKFMQQLPDMKSPDNGWWVGFSGGLDSTVLLHLLKSAYPKLAIAAIHVNHQISPNADDWQQHCEHLCQQWGVKLVVEKVSVKNQGYGIEDAARSARYGAFKKYLLPNDYLLTAHHADDQAETMLLRLLRGTGSRGLSGIAAERVFDQQQNIRLLRPLLSFTRDELAYYANHHQLQWIEDESNFSAEYDRNYLRLQVLPLLQSRWSKFQIKWNQTAKLCSETETLLIEMAVADLRTVEVSDERIGESINRILFSQLSGPRQHNLLRYWLSIQGYSIPEQQHWNQIELQIFSEKTDSSINVQWGNVSLRVYQDKIFALPLILPELTLSMTQSIADVSIKLLRSDLPNIHTRTRTGGERCRPAGRNHSQTLKKCLQEFGLEPWLRDSVPLIYSENNLVAVGDLWICAEYLAEENQAGLKLVWSV